MSGLTAAQQLERLQALAVDAEAQEAAERERLGAEQYAAKQRRIRREAEKKHAEWERQEAQRPTLEKYASELRREYARRVRSANLLPCLPSGGTRRLAPGRPRAGRRVATRGSPASDDGPEEPAEPLTALQTALHYVASTFAVVRDDDRAQDAFFGVLASKVAREYAKTLDQGERP